MRTSQVVQPRPIKLTYLITDLEVGGVPLHLHRLATRLSRDEFDIRVISLADEGPVGRQLVEAGIPVRACGARSARHFGALTRLWRYLRAEPPDILHALLFHANMASRLVGPLAGVRPRQILNEIQTVEIERTWHLWMDRLSWRLCRMEIGNSPSVVEHLHQHARIPKSRLRCEWGAVDIRSIVASTPLDRSTLGVAPDEALLLWTGRLDPVKGFEELFAALEKMRHQRRFKLALCGEGPYRPAVERLIQQNGLQDHVLLLGQRNDVPRLLRTADVFVFSSRTEGLPNSLLEAMAAALPIVATDVPGCRDLIRDRETGLLVTPRSAEALARGLDALLADPSLARQLGTASREWVTKHADVQDWAPRWSELYKKVLQGEL